jgi:hypothetical protein
MTMQKRYWKVIVVLAAMGVAPAWAVNKCTGADGKVSYQEAPCAGQGGELKIRQQGNQALPVEKKPTIPVATPAAPPASAAAVQQPLRPQRSELEIQGDQCLAYYRPKLRDPAGAYVSDLKMDKTVLTMKMHATNGFGGYVTREVVCEFKQNGELDSDWTKIHAQRIGWQ